MQVSGSVKASASVSIEGNPLAALGQAIVSSADVAMGAAVGGAMGAVVGGPVGAAAGAALGGGAAAMGTAVAGNYLENVHNAFGHQLESMGKLATGFLTGNLALFLDGTAQAYASTFQAYTGLKTTQAWENGPAQAHTPPRPRAQLEMSGRATVEGRARFDANIESRFKVKNGGYARHCGATFHTNSKSELQIEGKLSARHRAEVNDTFRGCMRTGVSSDLHVNSKLGFDLSMRCADNIALSPALTSSQHTFGLMLASRFECGGGWNHMRSAFDADFRVKVGVDVSTGTGEVGGPGEVDGTGETDGTAPTEEAKPGEGTEPGKIDLDNPRSILDAPGLSFEDMMFLFCLSMAKKQQDKIKGMMKRYDDIKKAGGQKKDEAAGAGKKDGTPGIPGAPGPGAAPAIPGMGGNEGGGGMPGLPGMSGGGGSPGVGDIVGVFKALGPMALDLAASTAPLWMPALCAAASAIPGVGPVIAAAGPMAMPLVQGGLKAVSGAIQSGALDGVAGAVAGGAPGAGGPPGAGGAKGPDKGGKAGGAGGKDKVPDTAYGSAEQAEGGAAVDQLRDDDGKISEQSFMQVLSQAQQEMSKMFEMCSNMTKSMHDSQMTAIRNMR